MRMRKMHWTDGDLFLSWTTNHVGGKTIDHEVDSKDRPSEDFIDALGLFAPLIIKLLKLPKNYDLEIRTVSLRWNDEGRRSLTVSGVHPVEASNGPFNVTTPLLREIGETGSGYQIVDDIFKAVDALTAAARKYVEEVSGAQLVLFGSEEEQGESEESGEYQDSPQTGKPALV